MKPKRHARGFCASTGPGAWHLRTGSCKRTQGTAGRIMSARRLPVTLMTLAVLASGHAAHAHGIAGNRFFPGTLAFDDPAVADEAIVPLYSTFKHPAEIGDGQVVDNTFNWSLFRLLTPGRSAMLAYCLLSDQKRTWR
jgi:hypothetical protein